MKKILFRKLLTDYLSFFFVALLSVSIIIWVFQAVNFLDIMIEDGRDYLIYIKYSLLNFPKIFSRLFPFVLFFSLFYVTIRYENNNELIIFWNFGINKITIINFIFKASLLLFLIQIILTSIIVPKSQKLAKSYIRSSNVNFLGNFVKPQKFNDTIKGVTIYTDQKDESGNLSNLYLKKKIDKNNFQITYAKKGVFKEINNRSLLILYNGETITSKNNKITNFSFSKSDFSLNNLETNTTTYIKMQEISTLDILRCFDFIYELNLFNKFKKIDRCSSANTKNFIKEFYKRLIIPFYIPILSLIPFLLLISSKENTNYFRLKFLIFLLGVIAVIFSETTIRLISNSYIDNFALLILPIFLILILYLFFIKKFILISSNL
ncbi:LptF/LptG family permease [Candidatus Pelagibacter sp.]|nr:LptF/LptG family permease [Candidatus Pelagibacter sp.]